jgi:hypothetical protein
VNYGFLISGELDRDRLAAALAEMLAVPVESVDVGDDGDDDRRWEAAVSCTVTPLRGDLHWHLDIYVSNAVPGPPPEPAAAAWLARRLRAVVGYSAAAEPPSAYWLVGPDGRRTRARIYEEDSDGRPAYRIDAVEHPLAALPEVPVAAVPEVIRNQPMATPVTDRLRRRLAAEGAEPFRNAITHLGAWESMTSRLTEGWPPDGWYPAHYYREDLQTRDELAAITATLPEPARTEFAEAVAEVDRRFADATDDDGGQALRAEAGPASAETPDLPGSNEPWWWHRITHPVPWQAEPGQRQR